jgi:aryl-alcohol dehydrogenase-like predicted oxidoreductase
MREIVIATKVHGRMHAGTNGAGLSRQAIFAEIDASLQRRGTDFMELYQTHRRDPTVPIEEAMEALHADAHARGRPPIRRGRVESRPCGP